MSILHRCAVRRGPPYAITHYPRHYLSAPTNVHQPGLTSCQAFSLRTGSPLTYGVLGRRCLASRKTPKPSTRAEALTALDRERYNRNNYSSNGVGPVWGEIAIPYAVLLMIIWAGTTFFWLKHSEEAPVTGRRRFAYFSAPDSSTVSLPEEVFQQLEEIQRLVGPISERVRQVFVDIAVAAGVDDREWKVYIIPDPDANASVSDQMSMVIIHGGMLKHIKCDDDLAVVLAHELAHVIANHDDERYSREMLQLFYGIPYVPAGIVGGLSLCAAMIVASVELLFGALLLVPVGVGQAMQLAAYRKQEEEADAIGLLLMTEAGYNPYAAQRVWVSVKAEEDQDFATAEAQARQVSQAIGRHIVVDKVPEHKRTHPLSESRVEHLSHLAPQALAIVKGDMRYLQRARVLINQKLQQGWADFKASRDGKRGRSPEKLN